MKSITLSFALAILVGAAVYVSAATTPPATQPTTAPTAGIFNKFCAVQQDNKIDPKVTTYSYKGKTIGFCCPDCIDDFKKDPEKYMATIK